MSARGGQDPAGATTSVDWVSVGWFTLFAYGGAWLVALPLWLNGRGLQVPWATAVLTVIMFTPALAVILTVKAVRRRRLDPDGLGIRFRRSGGARWARYMVGTWLTVTVIALAAPFVGAVFGLYALDLVHLSGFRGQLGRVLPHEPSVAVAWRMIAVQLASLVPAALINSVSALGEELGWRGFLLPRLLPLGRARALVFSGAVWGLWHAPVVLLGYNYPDDHLLGVPAMVGTTVTFGVILGWVRLTTASVWPAVVGHAALNAAAGSTGLFYAQGHPPNALLSGTTGITGWILPWLIIATAITISRAKNRRRA